MSGGLGLAKSVTLLTGAQDDCWILLLLIEVPLALHKVLACAAEHHLNESTMNFSSSFRLIFKMQTSNTQSRSNYNPECGQIAAAFGFFLGFVMIIAGIVMTAVGHTMLWVCLTIIEFEYKYTVSLLLLSDARYFARRALLIATLWNYK